MKTRNFPKQITWIIACTLLNLLCFNLLVAQSPSEDFATITPENANLLELGYVLSGTCAHEHDNIIEIAPNGIYDIYTGQKHFSFEGYVNQFSRDGKYIWYAEGMLLNTQSGDRMSILPGSFSNDSQYVSANDGVYKLESKTKLFSTPTWGWFSPDGQYLAVYRDAMYEVKTGEKRYILPSSIVEFSPDSRYFAVWNYGIYETETGKQIIVSSGLSPTFSPDSRYVAISTDGVYELKTQVRLIKTTSLYNANFSADSSLVAIANDGLYELPSATRRFNIDGKKYIQIPPYFAMDSHLLIVSGDGVYNLNTNQRQYPIASAPSINKSGSLIITDEAGVIETATGELKSPIAPGYFYGNGKFILQTLRTTLGNQCLIHGIKGDKWPYRSGLVNTSRTQIYDAPNDEKNLDNQGRSLTINGQLAVFAQTQDKQWLRVADGIWVKESDVTPVSLPDGIPVENS